VNALLRTPARRIALAVALSVLLHALALWLPNIRLPRFDSQLPLLTAKLEPLPMRPQQPVPRKHKAAPHKAPPRKTVPPPPASAETAPVPATPAAAENAAPGLPVAAAAKDTISKDKTKIHPLPRHAQLLFAAYKGPGSNGLYIGEMRHSLEIFEDGHYTLQAELQTVGLARLFKKYHLTQTSRGVLTPSGDLQPQQFSEQRVDDQGTQDNGSMFDWNARQLDFSNGTKAPLPASAQDILSFLYQLSQEAFNRELIPLSISNGKKLEDYQLEVGAEEDIITPLGKLRALHLRKVHAAGEEGLEIWLGLEYRMLPVKFQQIDRTGNIAGELAIKEIRLSDE
jgi:hypothetical protein